MDPVLIFKIVDLAIKTGTAAYGVYVRAQERAARENRVITIADIEAVEAEIPAPLEPK